MKNAPKATNVIFFFQCNYKQEKYEIVIEHHTKEAFNSPTIATLRSPRLSLLNAWRILLAAWFPEGPVGVDGGIIRAGFFDFCDLNHWESSKKIIVF